MGQKVNPIGLRLGIVKTWESRWYGGKNYAEYILEDHKLRKFIKEKLYHAGVSRIEIERSSKRVRLRIYTSRPGIVIGKKGAEVDKLREELKTITNKDVQININEINNEFSFKFNIDVQKYKSEIGYFLSLLKKYVHIEEIDNKYIIPKT